MKQEETPLKGFGTTQMIKNLRPLLLSVLATAFVSAALIAQSGELSISGQVTDPSGASVPAAIVTVTAPGGTVLEMQTDEQGRYAFRHLVPGTYTLGVQVQGFAPFEVSGIQVTTGGKPQVVDAQLTVAGEREQVTVQGEGQKLSISPDSNVGALVMSGKDLNALSDDPDDLQEELLALAGPAAGPNGGQIYIDGFSGGQLPPKEAILEVRVNQNPFSAQYPRLGYGRIDIITKPGYQKFHGNAFTFGNNSMFNSRNPFVTQEPNYHSEFFAGSIGGPIGKKASFLFNIHHRKNIANSIVNAVVLDPSLNPVPFSEAVRSSGGQTAYHPRVDFQLTSTNVLSFRGEYETRDNQNDGIGQFSLPSLAFDSGRNGKEIHISDTQVVNARMVTQTLLGYEHESSSNNPFSLDPTVRVIGAFTGGGNSGGLSQDINTRLEIRNNTSMSRGKHDIVFGARVRRRGTSVDTRSGYNGTFTFPSIGVYQITQQGLADGLTAEEIRAAGGGPSQFSITAGNPIAEVSVTDLAFYGEDTWRVRPNISLTYGLRFETQNQINDHADPAPRVGLAWGIGSGPAPKTVVRAGFGIFYDRFGESQVLQAKQLNGINQQRYLVNQPDFFPDIPPVSSLLNDATFPTIYQIDSQLHSPYTMQAAASIERQINSSFRTSVTYIKSHGVHQLLTNNVNAPLPGTYDPADPLSGDRPFGNVGNIYQYQTAGVFNEDQVIANFNLRMGPSLSLSGYYTLSYANTDSDGGFPSNPYNIHADYGPAGFAIRHRFFMRAFFGLPYDFEFSPFMVATSGHPYDITIGRDLNGDSIFNDRPAFAAPGATGPGIVATQFGTFNIAPDSGATVIPINYLSGPGQFAMSARLSKTFGLGKVTEGGGGSRGGYRRRDRGLGGRGLSGGGDGGFSRRGNAQNHRFQLEVGAMAHNIFNKVNLGTPVGNITSPLFGESTSLAGGYFGRGAANRSINLFLRFNF